MVEDPRVTFTLAALALFALRPGVRLADEKPDTVIFVAATAVTWPLAKPKLPTPRFGLPEPPLGKVPPGGPPEPPLGKVPPGGPPDPPPGKPPDPPAPPTSDVEQVPAVGWLIEIALAAIALVFFEVLPDTVTQSPTARADAVTLTDWEKVVVLDQLTVT